MSSGTSTPTGSRKTVTKLPAPTRTTRKLPDTTQLRPHRHHLGHLQGLLSHSARNALAPTEAFIGYSFRLIDADHPYPVASDEFAQREGKESTSEEEVVLDEDESILMWAMVVTDGVGTIDTGRDWVVVKNDMRTSEGDWGEVRKVCQALIKDTVEAATGLSFFPQICAISEPLPHFLASCPSFLPTLWMHLNTIPFLIRPPTMLFENLPDPAPEYYAQTAIRRAIRELHPSIHSALIVGTDPRTHEVLVDGNNKVFIASLQEYEDNSSPELWKRFMALVRHAKRRQLKAVFASATPSGGGVALMRHAMIRLMRLVGLDVRWIVPEGHPVVFNITKKHIHNVLQGVSQHGETVGPMERKYFEAWTLANWEAFWKHTGIFGDGRLVVIDDPQLTALIPLIKEKNPTAKIIFRSHIQIQSNLTDKPGTTQHEVFQYLWSFIQQSDLFLAHPVKFFVPKCVREANLPVLYMPPSTDPLDGLNKPLGNESVIALRDVYNNLSKAQCGVEMDWDRGYVLQVARFDPSKGLPVLLDAYLKFRKAIAGAEGSINEESVLEDSISGAQESGYKVSGSPTSQDVPPDGSPPPHLPTFPHPRSNSYDFGKSVNGFIDGFIQSGRWAPKYAIGRKPPMLVVVGHGSVDDPDGSAVYEHLHEIVQSAEYASVADSISIVRAPPSDTLLNMLMQGAWVACQLSTREGFEVKVSEAVRKRVPIIVSKAGGLSLQVKEGVNGWLVEPGESEGVATILKEIWEGKRWLKNRTLDGEAAPTSTIPEKEIVPAPLLKDPPRHPLLERAERRLAGGRLGEVLSNVFPHISSNFVAKNDPNTRADIFVQNVGSRVPRLRDSPGAPSEDFFTIGNATRWLLLWALLDEGPVEDGQHFQYGDVELLESMGLGYKTDAKTALKKLDGDVVWKMVMGQDMVPGEGMLL